MAIVKSAHAKLVILLVLLAMCAFVVDVLSPVTPTPTAHLVKGFVFGFVLLVSLAVFAGSLNELFGLNAAFPPFSTAKPNSRRLLTLICLLLF